MANITTFRNISENEYYWMEIYSPYGALYTKEAYVDIKEYQFVDIDNGYYDANSFSEANGNKTIHVEWYCDIDLVLGRIFDLINESLKPERGIRIDILRYLICFGYNNKNRHHF